MRTTLGTGCDKGKPRKKSVSKVSARLPAANRCAVDQIDSALTVATPNRNGTQVGLPIYAPSDLNGSLTTHEPDGDSLDPLPRLSALMFTVLQVF